MNTVFIQRAALARHLSCILTPLNFSYACCEHALCDCWYKIFTGKKFCEYFCFLLSVLEINVQNNWSTKEKNV